MKTKLRLLLLLFASLSLGLTSCSDDKEDNIVIPDKDLNVDNESVEIAIDGEQSIEITQGNGAYRAFSLNKDVATVSLSDNKLEVKGVGIGKTSVIVSDKEGELKAIPVVVYQYEKIILERESLDLVYKIGNSLKTVIKVNQGNGDYIVKSEDESIVTASVSGNEITIITSGKKEGQTQITVTDLCDREVTISVTAKSTTEPFSEAELADIMNQSPSEAPLFVFKDTKSSSYYSFLNTISDGANMCGYDYYNFYVLKVYFPGDKSVGEKAGSKIAYTNIPSYGQSSNGKLDLDNFKIIKNDGTTIWAIFSLIENGVLHSGYFIQQINP